MAKKSYYTVYKGDNVIVHGTKKECAAALNVDPNTIYFMSTPVYIKRREKSDPNNYLISIKVGSIENDREVKKWNTQIKNTNH